MLSQLCFFITLFIQYHNIQNIMVIKHINIHVSQGSMEVPFDTALTDIYTVTHIYKTQI